MKPLPPTEAVDAGQSNPGNAFAETYPVDLNKTTDDEDGTTATQLTIVNNKATDEAAEKLTPKITFPDGGWRAWMVCAGAWPCSAVTFGYISSFGVFQSYYQSHQLPHESPSNIAWIGSLQLFFIFFGGIFVGRLFDAGYHKAIIITGSILLVIAVFTTAECTTLWQFILAQGVCGGLGSGFLFTPTASVLSHWFAQKRALVYGIYATGSSVGGVIFPIMLTRLFEQVGFKWAVRTAGFIILGAVSITCAATQARLPPRKGGKKLLEFHHFRDPAFTFLTIGAFFIFFGLYTPIFYITSYAESKGVQGDYAFYLLAILNAASTFGRLIPNLFADKIGPQNILWPASTIAGIMCFVWLAASTKASITVFACIYGPASGSFVATIPACIGAITVNMNEIGARQALGTASMSRAALAGTPLTGALIRAGNSFVGPACFSGAVVLLGCGFGFFARHIVARRNHTWKA